ncbi:MAG: hypothetical protein DRJ35_07265, partial [Thermoprotei archaeon]
EKTLNVSGITPLPPRETPPGVTPELPCFISRTLCNFTYGPTTLKVRVCEAEILEQTCMPTPPYTCIPASARCKEGGEIFYATDFVRIERSFPARVEYEYHIYVPCNKSYLIQPEYRHLRPKISPHCEWKGDWRAIKGNFVPATEPFASGYDFTFEPYDEAGPSLSIVVNATRPRPRLGEPVEVKVLGYDDRGITSIWEKVDLTFVDGSSRFGTWVNLTLVPGMEGSTAGANFAIRGRRIMQARITVKVCDYGGNAHELTRSISFGGCDDGIQNYGETGVDCGGPCPSRCMNCLGDLEVGENPSAYLYSPEHWDDIGFYATVALREYAVFHGIPLRELDTSDEYIDAIRWWVSRHMGYRGDDYNEICFNEMLGLNYHPRDYGHGDFYQRAYDTILFSSSCTNITNEKNETWSAPSDANKWFFGDCDDFSILTSALLRSLGVSSRCVFSAEQLGHAFNIVNYKSKYRILEPQFGAIMTDDYYPTNIWNDKIGAAAVYVGEGKVRPYEYTLNYPGCEGPSVRIYDGDFGEKTLWLDWNGWKDNVKVGVADYNSDGMDDIVACWYPPPHISAIYEEMSLYSTGSGFRAPEEDIPQTRAVEFEVTVGCGRVFVEEPGLPIVRYGDPSASGSCRRIEFLQGPSSERENGTGNVTVGRLLWKEKFSFDGDLPMVGDFNGDGLDDIIKFGSPRISGDVYVSLSRGNKFIWYNHLWHPEFCLDGTPLIGDFNGDGRDDIVCFQNGEVYVALSTIFGASEKKLWKDNFCFENDVPLVGDFNGDGRDDIACVRAQGENVKIWVALANLSHIIYTPSCNRCDVPIYHDTYWPDKCP